MRVMRWMLAFVAAAGLVSPSSAQFQIDVNTGNLTRTLGQTWWFDPDNSGNTIALTNVNGGTLASGIMPGWAWTQWQFMWYTNNSVAEASTANGLKQGPANYEAATSNFIYDTSTSDITVTNDKTIGNITTWRDVLINSGVTLTLSQGGVMFHNASHWIKNNGGQGYLTSGYGGSGTGTNELFLICNGSSTDYQINDVIIKDNGATPVMVVKDGPDHLRLGAANTYSGGTVINRGRLQPGGTSSFGTGLVQVRDNNAQAYLAVSGTFANNFAIAGKGWNEASGQLGAIRMENETRIGGSVTLLGNARIGVYGSGVTGYLDGNLAGTSELEVWGGGALVLGANNTFAGSLLVTTGTLRLAAGGRVDSATNITVALGGLFDAAPANGYTNQSGRSIRGVGAFGGPITAQGNVIPGDVLTVGTLTFNSNLTYSSSASTLFNLSAPTGIGGGTNDLIVVAGDLGANGSIVIQPLAPLNTSTPYRLYNYSGLLGGGFSSVSVPNTRYIGALDYSTTNQVNLGVSGGPLALVWSGGSGLWDLTTSSNWNGNTEPFYNADTVTFDDTAASNQSVTLSGTLVPAAVIVSSASNYAFTGGGKISGAGGLTKSGTGALTIGTGNEYTGLTVISNGAVIAANNAALGTAAGGARVENGGTLALSNGITVADAVTLNGQGYAGGGALRNDSGNNALSAAVTLNGTSRVATASGTTLSLGGAVGGGGIEKTGHGILALNAANSFSGDVTVVAGTVRAGNGAALGTIAGQTYVQGGATLDLNGQNLGGEVINAQGAGVGDAGAIVNNGGGQLNATRYVNLLGETYLGGSGRWDIRSTGTVGSAALNGESSTLTKVGVNQLSLVGCVATVGLIQVSNGVLSIETDTTINPGYGITVAAGGGLMLWGLNPVMGRAIDAKDGATLLSTGGSGAQNTLGGTLTLSGTVTNSLAGGDMNLAGVVQGAGGLYKTGANTLYLLNNGNTYGGPTVIADGAVTLGTNGTTGALGAGGVTLAAGIFRTWRSDAMVVTNPITGSSGAVELDGNGEVRLTSVNLDGSAEIRIGVRDGTKPTLRIESGDSVTAVALHAGYGNSNRQGDILQNGGVLELTGAGNESPFKLGHWPGSASTYYLNGGLFLVSNVNAEVNLGIDGYGVWNMNGGTAIVYSVVVNGRSATGNGALNLSNGLMRVGAGGVYTEGSPTYSVVLAGGRLGAYGDYTFSVNAGLSNAATPFVIDTEGRTINLTGGLGGVGALAKEGLGTLVLNGANTFSGGLFVSNGTVRAVGNQAANRLVAGSQVTVTGSGSTFTFGEVNVLPTGANAVNFTLNSGGTLLLTNYAGGAGFHAHIANITMDGGQVLGKAISPWAGEDMILQGNVTVAGSAPSTMSFDNGMALQTGTRTFSVAEVTGDSAADLTINGPVKGDGSLRKTGAGSLLLTGASVYGGATVIDAGRMVLSGGANRLPTGTALSLADAAGVALDLGGNNQTVGSLSGGGMSGGEVLLGAGTLTVGNASTTTYSGVISGSGSLVKQGAGSLTLAGANIYSGNTTISGGALLLAAGGSIANTKTIDVAAVSAIFDVSAPGSLTLDSTQVLKGNGTVVGDIVFNAATLSPGSSPGLLTFSNDVTLANSASFLVEIADASTYDQVLMAGGSFDILSGNLTVSVGSYAMSSGTVYTLVSGAYSGTFAGLPHGSPIVENGHWYEIRYGYNAGSDIVLVEVPEPGALGLLGVAAALAAWRRRSSAV